MSESDVELMIRDGVDPTTVKKRPDTDHEIIERELGWKTRQYGTN